MKALHFTPLAVHATSLALLIVALVSPVPYFNTSVSLFHLQVRPTEAPGGAIGGTGLAPTKSGNGGVWTGPQDACWRAPAQDTVQCTKASLSPYYTDAYVAFNYPDDLRALLPEHTVATPAVMLITLIISFLSFFAILFGLCILHLRPSHRSHLRIYPTRLELGLTAARRILLSAVVGLFATFFLGISAALGLDRAAAQAAYNFNAAVPLYADQLAAGVPNLAMTGTVRPIMFTAYALGAVVFFTTGAEIYNMPTKPRHQAPPSQIQGGWSKA